MAKKKKKPVPEAKIESKPTVPSGLSDFISGDKAKWIFFAVYFILTVIVFRSFLFDDVMLLGSDTIPDGIYTRQYYKDYHEEFGGIPRWNPLILGGLPFIDAMHGDTFYPGAWLKFFMPLKRALGHKLIWHVFLAGVFMYLFLRSLKLRREAAFLGGIMYMLAPSFVTLIYPGHDAKMYVIAFLPLAFALLEIGMKSPKLYTFAGLGAVMGLLILTSHVQMAYYAFWGIGLYFFFRLLIAEEEERSGRVKKAAFFVLAVLIALTLGAVQLLPSYKFTTSQSVRAGAERTGYEYATSWSLHPEEIMGMVVPSFPGFEGGIGNITEKTTYWGRNAFKLNSEYHGILPLLFAVLALLTCRDKRTWFFLGGALLSLVYSLGAETPVYRLFYALVPSVKNFRAPSMIIFLFHFSICVMAVQFINGFFEHKTSLRDGDKRLLYSVGAIVAAALIGSVAMGGLLEIWQSVFRDDIIASRIDIMRANIPYITRDLAKTAIFAAAALAGLWMFLSRKIGVSALVILLGLVAFVDESLIDSRFIKVFRPETHAGTAPDKVVNELLKEMENKPPFRIFGLLTQITGLHSPNYYAMFGIQAANGHHNNELQTYELFKGGRDYKNYTMHWLEEFEFKQDKISDNNFLNVAGVKYIIHPNQGGILVENQQALGRAFIVHDCAVVPNDTLAVEMLRGSDFDPSKTAIINKDCRLQLPGAGIDTTNSRVVDITYGKDTIAIQTESDVPGLLVLSENYVPYWRVSLDGEPSDIYRAYGTFMAAELPAGSHDVVFSFLSPPYEKGKTLTLASLIFIIVACGISGVHALVKKVGKR
ncbi:hypothetical protein ACFL60_07475 [Candidatus Omnitrophota bacterium]